MLTGIKFIVITNSEREREELRDLIFSKTLSASVMQGGNGRQHIAISIGDVWFLSTVSEQLANSNNYTVFKSVEDFTKYFYKNQKELIR